MKVLARFLFAVFTSCSREQSGRAALEIHGQRSAIFVRPERKKRERALAGASAANKQPWARLIDSFHFPCLEFTAHLCASFFSRSLLFACVHYVDTLFFLLRARRAPTKLAFVNVGFGLVVGWRRCIVRLIIIITITITIALALAANSAGPLLLSERQISALHLNHHRRRRARYR